MLSANPLNRPTADEIAKILGQWFDELFRCRLNQESPQTELLK